MSRAAGHLVRVVAGVLWAILLVCALLAPAGAHVGSDVGYYLPLAEGLAHGHAPLLEVPVHYTPLAIAMLALPALLVNRPPYEFFAATQLAVIVLGAWAAYLFARRLGTTRAAASLGAGYFVLCSLYFESSTMLEPFVVLFGAWALVLAWTPWSRAEWAKWLLVGLLCALAVLCKQQGVFVAAGVGWLIGWAAPNGERRFRLLFVALGGAVGAGVLLGLVVASNLGVQASLANLTWAGRQYSGSQVGAGVTLVLSLLLLKTSPFLFGVPVVRESRSVAVGLVIATIAACVPAVLKPYTHYLVLALPFTAPLAALVLDALLSSTTRRQPALVFVAAVLGLWVVQGVQLVRRYRGPEANLNDLREAGARLEAETQGQRVLQLTSPALTWFARLTPADVEFAGYMFGGYFRLDEVEQKLLPNADVVVAEESARAFEFNDGTFQFETLRAHGFCPAATKVPRLALWRRCSVPSN